MVSYLAGLLTILTYVLKLKVIFFAEFLCEAAWLSVDPYMRPYTKKFALGSSMIGGQVAKCV